MMLFELSLRNARRQAKDYLVYFLTIIMVTMLTYAFNALLFSQELADLAQLLDTLPFFIVFTSLVVVLIVGWLISYTVKFMLLKRSREFGTYILLGIEPKQIAKLFFWENLLVGGGAMLVGVAGGCLFYQVLRAIVMHSFGQVYQFRFELSLGSLALSVCYFILMYCCALLRSRKRIAGMKIFDLLYSDKRNEESPLKNQRARQRIFRGSLVLGLVGFAMLLVQQVVISMIGAVLLIAFIYGFFISFAAGIVHFFDQHPQQKYRGTNLLVMRTLTSKMATMGVVMATITLLLTATMLALGSGAIFQTLFQRRTDNVAFDLIISTENRNEAAFAPYQATIEQEVSVKECFQYPVLAGEQPTVLNYIENHEEYLRRGNVDKYLAYSDYQQLRKLLGYERVSLAADQYLIHCLPYLEKTLTAYQKALTIAGQDLKPSGQVFTEDFNQLYSSGNGEGFIIVVADALLTDQPAAGSIQVFSLIEGISERAFQELEGIREARYLETDHYDKIEAVNISMQQNMGIGTLILFPLYFLALIAVLVAATILTIQLLSENRVYRQQYALLDKLGMERCGLLQALRTQLLLFFFLPLGPAVAISLPFLVKLGFANDPGIFAGWSHLGGVLAVAYGLFFIVYLSYVLAAYVSLKRSVLPQS